jgi:hypothetical protein
MANDIFERLNAGRPTEVAAKRSAKIQHAQKLLDWLQRWPKSIVYARDFCVYGPRPRDRKNAISSAEILVASGWLIPTQTHRYDSQAWRIVQKPIIFPQL